jgi:DNA-directed RNA polymerase subunit E'
MYSEVDIEDTIRIPPNRLSEKPELVIEDITHETFDGVMGKEGFIVITYHIEKIGASRIIHGDGGVYQDVRFKGLLYNPENQEVVDGIVDEVVNFGCFVRIGPLDALLHISQIMEDHIDVDLRGGRLIGRESRRDIKKGDKIRARIVSVSLNFLIPRESKIGLTLKQSGLGKFEWLEEERKKEVEISEGV